MGYEIYQSRFTGATIDEKLGKVATLEEDVSNLKTNYPASKIKMEDNSTTLPDYLSNSNFNIQISTDSDNILEKTVNGYKVAAAEQYTLPTASTSTLGGVKVDNSTITVDDDGTIHGASTYELPIASISTLGGVKVDGDTITIDENGVIKSNSNVKANPSSIATKTLNKLEIDNTVYSIEGGGTSDNGSTINNLFFSYEDYNEEEKVIGKWIDGRPIYRKCFSGIVGTNIETNLSNENINIVNIYGIVTYNNRFLPLPYVRTDSANEQISLDFRINEICTDAKDSDFIGKSIIVIFEYTKTTDAENSFLPSMITNNIQISGVGCDIYSEDEIVIGKWTDGKPIYRKVITSTDISDIGIEYLFKAFSNYSNEIYSRDESNGTLVAISGSENSYKGEEIINIIPTFTSDNERISSSRTDGSAYLAFDGDDNTIWENSSSEYDAWIIYDNLIPVNYEYFEIYKGNCNGYVTIQGSNDKITWVNIANRVVGTEHKKTVMQCTRSFEKFRYIRIYHDYNNQYKSTFPTRSFKAFAKPLNISKYITIEYTKITDSSNSFLPDMMPNYLSSYENYSEEEQIVGRWIDGRPVYRKLVYFNLLNIQFSSMPSISFNTLGITNVDAVNIIKLDGSYRVDINTNYEQKLSWGRNDTDYFYALNWYKGNNNHALLITGKWGINTSHTITDVVIILEYTKTTDAENSFNPSMITGNTATDEANMVKNVSDVIKHYINMDIFYPVYNINCSLIERFTIDKYNENDMSFKFKCDGGGLYEGITFALRVPLLKDNTNYKMKFKLVHTMTGFESTGYGYGFGIKIENIYNTSNYGNPSGQTRMSYTANQIQELECSFSYQLNNTYMNFYMADAGGYGEFTITDIVFEEC